MHASKAIPYVLAIAAIAVITIVFLPLHDVIQGNPGTIALAQVVIVLLIARRWGVGPATLAALFAVVAWNFFYLPPYFSVTLTKFKLEDAVLLVVFMITIFTVGQLSARATRRAEQAEADRERIRQLYTELQQQHAARQQAQEALNQAHRSLESRILERTHQLKLANVKLQNEILERKRAEELRREKEVQISSLIASNIIGISFWNLDGAVTDANDAFLQLVGYSRQDLDEGKINWRAMTPPEYTAVTERALEELRSAGRCRPYEKEFIASDGRRVPLLIGSTLFAGSRDKGMSFVLDLTERKLAESQIRALAHHDALTGLPNRLLLHDRVSQAIAQAHRASQRVGMLFIDLDHFKLVNDSLGHQGGDELLRAVAERLLLCVREGDSVARLGGDEFVIALPALTTSQDAALVARKVLDALDRPFQVAGHEAHVTGSIGISLYPTDGKDTDSLLRAADVAMYHAKETGRNGYQFFTPKMNEIARSHLQTAHQLHQGVERGEFLLHYQPELDLGSGKIIAAEALIRWRPPGAALVACGEFLKVAEETGLILSIGGLALRQACEQVKFWRNNGYPSMRVAVNLSPRQFREPRFYERVAETLAQCDLPGQALELEVTENTLMLRYPDVSHTLEKFFVLGVQISVDDFGMGYSSLAYLQRFPIHALKIDRSLVNGIGRDPNDTAIVSAVIAIGERLHLRVIAEGVETLQQLEFLKQHHCTAAQGHYYCEALPVDRLNDALRGRIAPFQSTAG